MLVAVVTINLEEPGPLNDAGLNPALVFAGKPAQANETGPLKPLFVARVTVWAVLAKNQWRHILKD